MNPTITRMAAQQHSNDLLRYAAAQRRGRTAGTRARKLFGRRAGIGRRSLRVATA
jgi:hypothetical protein